MKIDNECVRNILFAIEEKSSFKHPCRLIFLCSKEPKLSLYDDDKIDYHLRYMEMKGLIYNPTDYDKDGYDLTPLGHEFAANIRDESNWNKIKGISANIGFASLKVITAIAEGVATAAINKQLGVID